MRSFIDTSVPPACELLRASHTGPRPTLTRADVPEEAHHRALEQVTVRAGGPCWAYRRGLLSIALPRASSSTSWSS